MVAIAGPQLSRRAEWLVLALTAIAALVTAVVPATYAATMPASCSAMALAAPSGRRLASAIAVWCPVSLAMLLGAAA